MSVLGGAEVEVPPYLGEMFFLCRDFGAISSRPSNALLEKRVKCTQPPL